MPKTSKVTAAKTRTRGIPRIVSRRASLDDFVPVKTADRITPGDVLGRADSYSRLPILLALAAYVEAGEWFQLLGDAWSTCDNIGERSASLAMLFHAAGPAHISRMMTSEERAAHAGLPGSFSAWRGCYDFNQYGFSYSLDKNTAAGFPFLNRYRQNGRQAILVEARIKRTECVIKLDRSEREIIAFSPKIVSITPLQPPATGTRAGK